jgi:hypothetical protein
MARSRWERRGRGGHDPKQYWAAGILAAAGVAIFAYFLWPSPKAEYDKETLCPAKVDSVTAVLLDATDELSSIQREDIRNRLDAVKLELPTFGRIDLYALGDSRNGMTRKLFSMCNPGTGAEADRFNQNQRLMKQKWTKDFSARLDDELGKALVGTQGAESPIMEAIKDIAVQSFGAAGSVGAANKHLIVASDMIEFTPAYSQYAAGPALDFDRFARTPFYQRVRTDHLRGVAVEVFYVRRQTAKNVSGSKEHRMFWENFFRASGGQLSHFAPI